ncbi:MAG: hypothetical protein HY399_04245 [Elusimicrobia bacterium]|nr:hypothetical protein [Elusimicrobiota bacterium]
MRDKVFLLMKETGCEREEAELALELCRDQLEKAVREVPRLSKNIGVVKGKFLCPSEGLHGLLLVVLHLRSQLLVRTCSVLSYNPALCMVPLEMEWFEFEKSLYRARLADGTVQMMSQELEHEMMEFFNSRESIPLYGELKGEGNLKGWANPKSEAAFNKLLGRVFRGRSSKLMLRSEVLYLGQFQSPRREESRSGEGFSPDGVSRTSVSNQGISFLYDREKPKQNAEFLILRVAVEGDLEGIPSEEVQPGDFVHAQIIDPRDIAQYLAKLFGGMSEEGLVPLRVLVESVESLGESQGIRVRVRFSRGVFGEACVPSGIRLKATRRARRRVVTSP